MAHDKKKENTKNLIPEHFLLLRIAPHSLTGNESFQIKQQISTN
jgi:hypothetical protein